MDTAWIAKYKVKKEYHLVYSMLIEAARRRGTVTYQEIAEVMGLPLKGSHMGREIGNMIGAISYEEVQADRPMLSAIVVGVNGKPGEGLFYYARELGQLESDDRASEDKWLRDEMKAVYETWQKEFKTK